VGTAMREARETREARQEGEEGVCPQVPDQVRHPPLGTHVPALPTVTVELV
jgi:hypothetical protein